MLNNTHPAQSTAPKEGVGLLSAKNDHIDDATTSKAVDVEGDGARGQDKARRMNSMARDESKAKKGMEAYSDDSKEELKNDEVLLFC